MSFFSNMTIPSNHPLCHSERKWNSQQQHRAGYRYRNTVNGASRNLDQNYSRS